MERRKFTPVPGQIYRNHGGGEYRCLRGLSHPYDAVMQNTASGWILMAYGCGLYPDGTIDWDYSSRGHFAPLQEVDS